MRQQARRTKSGRQENVGTKFSNLTTPNEARTHGVEARNALCMYVHTHTHTHTRTHVCTRPRVHTGRAYSIPYLISLPGIYIFPRWPSADVPFNAAKMPEEKFLVASRQRFSPNILAAACLFSSIPYGNIPSEYRAGRSSTIIIIAVSPFNRVTPIFTSVI